MSKVALEAHALGDSKARDHTALDLLAGLPGSFTGSSLFPSLPIEVADKSAHRCENRGADDWRGRELERVVGPRTKKETERRIGTSNPVHRIEYWEGWRIFDVVKAEICFEHVA